MIYQNLVRDRFLGFSQLKKEDAVEDLKDSVGRMIRDQPERIKELTSLKDKGYY